MLRVIVLLYVVLFSSHVLSAGSSGWRGVKSLKVEDTKFVAIYGDTPFANPDNCGTSDIAVIRWVDESKDQKFSIALSAYMSNQKIQMYFGGCEPTPWGYTAPIAYNIVIGM